MKKQAIEANVWMAVNENSWSSKMRQVMNIDENVRFKIAEVISIQFQMSLKYSIPEALNYEISKEANPNKKATATEVKPKPSILKWYLCLSSSGVCLYPSSPYFAISSK